MEGAGFSVCTFVFEIPLRHQGEVSCRQIAPQVWNSVESSGAINLEGIGLRIVSQHGDWLRSRMEGMQLKKSRAESKVTLRCRGWQGQDSTKETELESLCLRSQVKEVSLQHSAASDTVGRLC